MEMRETIKIRIARIKKLLQQMALGKHPHPFFKERYRDLQETKKRLESILEKMDQVPLHEGREITMEKLVPTDALQIDILQEEEMIEWFMQLEKRYQAIINKVSSGDKANLDDAYASIKEVMGVSPLNEDDISHVLNEFEDALNEIEAQILPEAKQTLTPLVIGKTDLKPDASSSLPENGVYEVQPDINEVSVPKGEDVGQVVAVSEPVAIHTIDERLRSQLERVRLYASVRDFDKAYRLLNDLRQRESNQDSDAVAEIEKARLTVQQTQRDAVNQFLSLVDGALQDGDFVNAENWLASARQYALDDAHQTAIQEKQRKILQAQEGDRSQLQTKIEEALKVAIDNQNSPPEEIALWIDEYAQLSKGLDKENTVKEWLRQVQEIKKPIDIEKAVATARIECIDLWHEGGVPNAKAALDLVQELENKYGIHPQIVELKEKAEDKWQNARIFAKESLTSATTGQFELLISEYEKLLAQGTQYVPHVKLLKNEQGNFILTGNTIVVEEIVIREAEEKAIDIDAAISELKDFAKTYARQKAEEKIEQAITDLAQNPKQAKNVLIEALSLYLLADEDKQKVEQYQQNVVVPAIERREKAEQLRNEAELLEVFAGWQQLQKAVEKDVHVPGIAEVQDRLRPRLRERIDGELGSLQRELRAIPRSFLGQPQAQQQYREAMKRATELAGLIDKDVALVDLAMVLNGFVETNKQTIEEYSYVTSQVERIRETLRQKNYAQASQGFAEVKERLGEEGIKAYPELLGIRSALDMRGNVEGLVGRIEADLGGTDDRLDQYIDDLEGALAVSAEHPGLAPLLKRVRSRLNYRRGRVAYEQKSFAEARRLLEAVDSEDRAEAQNLLRVLGDAEYEKGKLRKALSQAENNQRAGLWREAYNLLHPWASKPRADELEARFLRVYKTITEGWEQAAIQLLSDFARERPLHQRKIEEQLNALADLGSRSLNEWQKKALAPCYAQSAREKAHRGKLQESIHDWQEALRFDPDNATYQEALVGAEKEKVRQQVAAAPNDLVNEERLYKNLRLRHHEDPEIRLRLADVYLRQGQFEATAMELSWLKAVFTQTDYEGEPAWPRERDRLEEQLKQERDIHQQQRNLLTQLQPGREISEYKTALSRYEELKKKYPDTPNLTGWWDEQVNRLARELEAQTEALLNVNEPLWKAAAPVLKILVLQIYNGYARDLIGKLAHQVLGLTATVDELLRDTVGRYEVPEEQALDDQIKTTAEFLEEVGAYRFALSQHVSQVADAQEKQGTLEAHRLSLDTRLRNLRKLKSELQQGRAELETARTTGKWERAAAIEGQLKQGEFARHRTVGLFLRDLDEARATRQQLEAKVTELSEALKAEAFTQAQQAIIDLQALDPEDGYDIWGKLQITTSLRPRRPIPFLQLEELIANHLADLKTLYRWLFPVLKVAPWFDPRIADGTPPDGDIAALNAQLKLWLDNKPSVPAPDSVLWSQTTRYALSAIRTYRDQGRFDLAQQLCGDVLGEDGRTQMMTHPFTSYHPLLFLHNHLTEKPSLQTPDLQSKHSQNAEQVAQACRERIHEWLSQARQNQADLTRDEADFQRLLKLLRDKVDQLGRIRIFGKPAIRDQGLALYNQAHKLCPNHKMLGRLHAQLMSS